MDRETHPANQNRSFTQMTRNPQRELAMDIMGITIDELQTEGVSHQIMADVLFEYLRMVVAPPGEVDGKATTVWYAQLHRFRDALQFEIDELEKIFEGTSN